VTSARSPRHIFDRQVVETEVLADGRHRLRIAGADHVDPQRASGAGIGQLAEVDRLFDVGAFGPPVYGMNFDPSRSPLNMPEVRWFWGYPFALGLMALTAIGLLLLFRRRRWF
jgi:hypothetical protein